MSLFEDICGQIRYIIENTKGVSIVKRIKRNRLNNMYQKVISIKITLALLACEIVIGVIRDE